MVLAQNGRFSISPGSLMKGSTRREKQRAYRNFGSLADNSWVIVGGESGASARPMENGHLGVRHASGPSRHMWPAGPPTFFLPQVTGEMALPSQKQSGHRGPTTQVCGPLTFPSRALSAGSDGTREANGNESSQADGAPAPSGRVAIGGQLGARRRPA